MNHSIKHIIFSICILGVVGSLQAQQQEKTKEQLQLEKEAENYLADGSMELSKENFPDAEVNYRKAIALNPSEGAGKYNLGNAYYNREKNEEAMLRYQQAAATATSKTEKHKAFHNLGNSFMNAKMYQEAVEAYKNALRNDSTDEETRYNLALAKEMLEKNPPQGGDGEDDNEDKDQQDNQDENQDQDQQDQDNQDQNQDGDDGEDKEDKDQGDENEEQNDGNDEGENKKPEENKEEPNNQQRQPKQGQMSPQQIKNLLDAMNNEEKKVQDKINVQKQKGAKVKSNKDW